MERLAVGLHDGIRQEWLKISSFKWIFGCPGLEKRIGVPQQPRCTPAFVGSGTYSTKQFQHKHFHEHKVFCYKTIMDGIEDG